MAKSFLRIRPINGYSSKDPLAAFFKLDETRIECRPPVQSQTFKNSKSNLRSEDVKKRIFEFDKILDETANQEQLYNDCVQPLLTQYFDGDNVMLFAYGTTSSGKTFTIKGDPRNLGVVPRCISDIFESVGHKLIAKPKHKRIRFNEWELLTDLKRETEIKTAILNAVDDKSFCLDSLKFRPDGFKSFLKEDENIRHIVWVSFLELYNENLVDLLLSGDTNERTPPLKIMRDTQGNFFVSGLRHVYVNSADEAMKVYLYGADNLKKHISSTAMNRTSSRSHSVFTISVITLKKKRFSDDDYSVLHVNNFSLCDLAGQERGKKTQTTGIHLKEAGSINRTLFQLRRCIQVMKERKERKNTSQTQLVVPFTESALTKVFQPYLTGSGLTFMIININPKSEHFDETVCSLEFSATASSIEIIRNESTNSLRDKMQRFTQNWLQTSKRWSTVHNLDSQTTSAFITDGLSADSQFKSTASEATSSDDIIVDTQNILSKSKFDSTYFDITQKMCEMEDTIVEMELYDAEYVEELAKRIDELNARLENADRDPEQRKTNLECIHNSLAEIYDRFEEEKSKIKGRMTDNSVAEIYERHEEEKAKIKERMTELMENRMEIMRAQYEGQIQELEQDAEALNMQLLSKDNEVAKNCEHIAKLNEELEQSRKAKDESERRLLENDEEHRKQLQLLQQQFALKEQQFAEQLLKSENEKLEIEMRYCVDHLVSHADYEVRLEELLNSLRSKEANKSGLNKTADPQHSRLNDDVDDPLHASARTDSATKAMSGHIEPDHSFRPFSLLDHQHKHLKGDMNTRRSSLKRPLPFDLSAPQESLDLFTTDMEPIRNADHPQSKLQRTTDHPSVIEASAHLSSTTAGRHTNRTMQNADQLLESMVGKNLERENEEIKKQKEQAEVENKQLQHLLDIKDEEIKNLRADVQRMNKEINRMIKDDGHSIQSGNHAKLTQTLYNSVLNHSQYVPSKTPYKPLSHLAASNRKKRNIEEESAQTSDARYLDYIKNTEKSPATEKKAKKKRTVTEKKRKVKEEIIEEKIVEESEKEEEPMDDLLFFVEGTTKKKGRKKPIKVSF